MAERLDTLRLLLVKVGGWIRQLLTRVKLHLWLPVISLKGYGKSIARWLMNNLG